MLPAPVNTSRCRHGWLHPGYLASHSSYDEKVRNGWFMERPDVWVKYHLPHEQNNQCVKASHEDRDRCSASALNPRPVSIEWIIRSIIGRCGSLALWQSDASNAMVSIGDVFRLRGAQIPGDDVLGEIVQVVESLREAWITEIQRAESVRIGFTQSAA